MVAENGALCFAIPRDSNRPELDLVRDFSVTPISIKRRDETPTPDVWSFALDTPEDSAEMRLIREPAVQGNLR